MVALCCHHRNDRSFSILGFITSLAYENAPPIPDKVIDNKNSVLFTKENILDGQSAFLKYNLMEHGTLWGGLFHTLEWIRLGADALFILVGVVPTVTAIFITYRYGFNSRRKINLEEY